MDCSTFQLHARMEDEHWWFVGRRNVIRQLAHRIAPPGVQRTVVDVGCGTGATVNELRADYKMVGIEPSREAVALARARFPDAEFIHGEAPRDLGELAKHTDLFLIMDVLEHVADEVKMLADLIAAARPGSHLLITVPARPELWSEHDVTHGHYRRYLPHTLRDIWRGQPVTARLVSSFNARLYPIIRAARLLSRARHRAVGTGATDLSLPPAPLNRLLARTLAGEAGVLVRHLENGRTPLYPIGASLIAVLRREIGEAQPRSRVTEGTFEPEPPSERPLSKAPPE